ncbi:amidase domain-containing protein [Agromyces allii]|uniref:IPT/TIG domain-containing protein n=1 Tax=Agromyces allii TaxID=393607 RepID=A0ABN2QN11_9MICO|nr:amidase domain-containing protein [Agromyces allii]
MLKSSDLPILRRATFRAPSATPDPQDAPSYPLPEADASVEADRSIEAEAEASAPVVPEPLGVLELEPADVAADASEPADVNETDDEASAASRSRLPRHRADRIRNRRGRTSPVSKGAVIKRTAALGSAAAFMGLSAFGALVPAEAESSTAASESATHEAVDTVDAAALDSIAPAAEVDLSPKITSGLSTASAPFTGGTQITLTGHSLDEVAAVTVGDTPATIVAADESSLTFQVPAVAETAKGAAVQVSVVDAAGAPVEAVKTEAPISSTASLITALEPAALQAEAAVEQPIDLTFTFTSDPGIDAQLNYVLAHWNNYNTAQYPVLSGVDCANFASQSLAARGFAMDGGWYFDGATGAMSPSWASSTALRDYLLTQTTRATYLDDSQRWAVKVGDIAQFDWDDSGDRDHTAVVTRVEHTDAGTKIWVGGHTKDADYWDVDEALASGGGSVTYFSIH